MYAQVDHALRRAYAVPDIYLVWVNITLAGFVTLSHGGALLVALSKDSPQLDEIRALAMLSLPLCALVLVSAVAGLLHRGWMRRVLMVHSGVVVLSAVVLILWSLKLLFMGIPRGTIRLDGWYAYGLGHLRSSARSARSFCELVKCLLHAGICASIRRSC
jgi:hypothetical protein